MVDDEDSRTRAISNFIRQGNALISHFLNVPFPEELDDDTWFEKFRQVEWLSHKGILSGITPKA